jgi:hypothetical protein
MIGSSGGLSCSHSTAISRLPTRLPGRQRACDARSPA